MNAQTGIIGFIVLVILAGGAYLFVGQSSETMMEKKDTMVKEEAVKDVMEKKDDVMMEKTGSAMAHGGTYEAYAPEKIAWAKNGKVILYFRASWCPVCKALDADIRSHFQSIPKDVTILDLNYDTETALKQKYGVTYQHTFVQVDASGNSIKKWSGSPTLAALVSNVQ